MVNLVTKCKARQMIAKTVYTQKSLRSITILALVFLCFGSKVHGLHPLVEPHAQSVCDGKQHCPTRKVEDPTVSSALKFIQGYTDDTYNKMKNDRIRTESYKRAIQALSPGKIVLDIGTGALALLAIFAAQAGAKKVYAVEANSDAFHKARDAVARANLTDKVEIYFGHSTNLSFPSKVDIVVHEILGEIASIEGAAYVLRDARLRLLHPPKVMVQFPHIIDFQVSENVSSAD